VSQILNEFRNKYATLKDLSDEDVLKVAHYKFINDSGSDMDIDAFSQNIGYQPRTETPAQQDPIQAQQATDKPITGTAKQLDTGYPSSTDMVAQRSQVGMQDGQQPIELAQQPKQIDAYTGADTKQPFKPMGELVMEKLSSIGGAVAAGTKNVAPQFKAQLGGLMQTQENPLLTPTEFYGEGQTGKISGIPMKFDRYEDYTAAHKQNEGIGSYIAQKGKELRSSAAGEMKPTKSKKGSTEYYVEQGVGSILNMVPMLAVSIAGKRPDIGLGIMLAQVNGDAYGKGREKGLTQNDAKSYAAFQSIAEVIPSAMPLGQVLAGNSVIRQSLTEGAQEVVTAGLQAGIDKGYIDSDMTWMQAVERMKEAAIIGVGSGATIALATKPFAPKQGNYDDDPLKAVAAEMESEAANNEIKDLASKAFDTKTANTLFQEPEAQEQAPEVLPGKPDTKPKFNADIKQEAIDQEGVPKNEAVSFDVPAKEINPSKKVITRESESNLPPANASVDKNKITEPLTKSKVMGLNYTNGITEAALNAGVNVTKNESAPSIRKKIIEKLELEPKQKTIENDTRGKGVQYHGTSSELKNLDDAFYSTMNIYGQGFYTTDAKDIATGYSKKGKGKSPAIYTVNKNKNLNLLDMEQPISEEVKSILKKSDADNYEDIIGEVNNLREYYDERRLIDNFEPADEVQGAFDSIATNLSSKGYDGLSHIGGLKTNNKTHNVEIIFKPTESLNITKESDFIEPPKDNKNLPKQKEQQNQQVKEGSPAGLPKAKVEKEIVSNKKEKEKIKVIDQIYADKNIKNAISFISENSDSELYKSVAKKILPSVNKTLEFKIYEIGDKAPRSIAQGMAAGSYAERFDRETGLPLSQELSLAGKTSRTAEQIEQTLLHESIHHVVNQKVRVGNMKRTETENPELSKQVKRIYDIANVVRNYLLKNINEGKNKDFYQVSGKVTEFPTWALTDPEFQEMLKKVPYKKDVSAWGAFVKTISNVLGLRGNKDYSAFEAVIDVTDSLIETDIKAKPTEKKRKTFSWDRVELSKNYTAKELDKWIQELSADPDNKNLDGGIQLLDKKTQKKIDQLSWAVYYLGKEGREADETSQVQQAKDQEQMPGKKKTPISQVMQDAGDKSLTDADKVPGQDGYTAKSYTDFRKAIADQSFSAKEILADAESLIKNKDKIIAEMSDRKFTKAMLQKITYSPRSDLKKPQMVKQAYQEMLSAHVMADATITIFGESQSFEEQIIEQIKNQTQKNVESAYEKQREYRAERTKQIENFKKSLANPETLPEFKEFIRVRGKNKMTAKQLASYDELVSESLQPEDKPVVVTGEAEVIKTERAQTTHSKTGADLFVVKMLGRVEKDKFRDLNSKAKQFGGYYSSYSKDGAIPGFQFKTVESADQFENLLSGADVDKSDFTEAKAEVKQSKNAQKLLDMAESMENKATEEINRPRQANTAKRASQSANATERAEKKLALAKTVRNIAIRLQQGELTHLGKMSQVTQLEELISIQSRAIPNDLYEHGSFDGYSISRPLKQGVTVEDYISNVDFPKIELARSIVDRISTELKGKRGYARLSADLKKLPSGRRESSVLLNKEQADKIMAASKDKILESYSLSWLPDQVATANRLSKLGISTGEQLRAAIRELESMREAVNKPDPVKTLERALVGKKIPGFFPTPKPLVEQMIDFADIKAGHQVLEPSAGKGDIANEISNSAPDAELSVIEFNDGLSEILKAKGFNVVGDDFLKHNGSYDRIVMNPPFENFQDIEHVKHAYELLKPGGKLVAIMGASVKNSRKQAVEFREWLDNAGSYIEDNPEGSFKSSDRPTGVSTVMVTIEKNDTQTLNYREQDNNYKASDTQPVNKSDRVFNAPGHNHIGTFRSLGIPERREFVMIENRRLTIPNKPQRIEPIMNKLVQIMGRRIYFGKIKGKSSEGFYRPSVGEIRTRKKNDVEVLAHEMAHYLDFYSNITLPNFKKLYKKPEFQSEVSALSYTDADQEIELIEGFAEFVRLWLTNSQEALIRAPKFYEEFTNLLARDRKLLNPMRDMQDLMHKFYFQGPDKLGQALIGSSPSFSHRFNEWTYRRDSLIRQQTIDRFHAARKVEQELTGKIGDVQESAWKQFRIANGGSESISDYVLNYGTVNFDERGDLQRTGKSLHEVLEPVKSITLNASHKGDQKIDVLLRYFAGRRALELHSQGRENLIPKETAKEWAKLGSEYPIFESIHKEYQAFNDRMLDFFEESGMVTPEGRKAMQSMNKDYVPFNRIRDQLAGGKGGAGGIQKLKGGTANLNDILVNMQDGITANVKAALMNRAKQRLYQYISNHRDGAIFGTQIAPDSTPVNVYADEMQSKIGKVLEANGIVVEGEIDLTDSGLLTFWQHGVKPKLNESGNIVDSVIINGKPKYYEVQDPLLQEMLLSMNPESYGSFMNTMFGIKNFFTRSITLGVEFMGANLVRDTIGATFMSKSGFKPFYSSFQGMYSFFAKDEHYQEFVRSGGGYAGRLEASSREGSARRRVSIDEFGVLSVPEKLLSSIDNLASAFEYGTRIGEFRLNKKNGKSSMDAGFASREISTDFAGIGSNRFLTGYIRTVPFLNAMVQSQDRVFREALVAKKYDGNPTKMAMKAFLGITIPTLLLYMVNKDDEDYKQIPDWEKRTNWHIKTGDGRFIKIPRPYDVGFVYATMPELFFKYIQDERGKEFADGMIWTMTQMYGIDGVPAAMTGWWDLVRNKKWTGAPVVPTSVAKVEATQQYTSNTSETFVRMGEALGISPIKAEHMFNAYTGYLGGYLLWGTDHMLWDKKKFGEKPDLKTSDNIFLKRFLTPDVRPASSAMEKFFNLKDKSDKVVATFRTTVDVRRKIKGQMKDAGKFKSNKFFGLSGKEKEVLFALNDSMNKLIKLMYGKEGIKTAELKIKYDKKLSGKQKREKIDTLWGARNKAFMQYYTQADRALQKAKREANEGEK
jgi:phospholipid N-methyltransferase